MTRRPERPVSPRTAGPIRCPRLPLYRAWRAVETWGYRGLQGDPGWSTIDGCESIRLPAGRTQGQIQYAGQIRNPSVSDISLPAASMSSIQALRRRSIGAYTDSPAATLPVLSYSSTPMQPVSISASSLSSAQLLDARAAFVGQSRQRCDGAAGTGENWGPSRNSMSP